MQILRNHKRSRVITALLLPAAILLFLIGWSLYWTGSHQERRKAQPEPSKDNVHAKAIALEEEIEN